MTLGRYLYECGKRGIIDFSLRAREEPGGVTSFYIRPADRDGETLDYYVVGGLTIEGSTLRAPDGAHDDRADSYALAHAGRSRKVTPACQNLKRKCRAVELSPAYVAVALQRFLDHAGIKPELIN